MFREPGIGIAASTVRTGETQQWFDAAGGAGHQTQRPIHRYTQCRALALGQGLHGSATLCPSLGPCRTGSAWRSPSPARGAWQRRPARTRGAWGGSPGC